MEIPCSHGLVSGNLLLQNLWHLACPLCGLHDATAPQRTFQTYLLAEEEPLLLQDNTPQFDVTAEYVYQDQMHGLEGRPQDPNESGEQGGVPHYGPQWALLKFSQPVTAPKVLFTSFAWTSVW